MARTILADSCFWFALFDERDEYHEEASSLEEEMSVHSVLVPWPTLYESLNTRLMRRKHQVARFRSFLEKPSTVLIEDDPYRAGSIDFVLNQDRSTYSLVDHVIRSILADDNVRVNAIITFNPSDFYDVCDQRGIEMLYRT